MSQNTQENTVVKEGVRIRKGGEHKHRDYFCCSRNVMLQGILFNLLKMALDEIELKINHYLNL